MTARELPPASKLTRAQHDGHACVWCGKRLWHGAVSAGIARGQSGAHILDVEVFSCPDCAPESPAAGIPPIRPRDEDGFPAREGWPS